MLVDKGIRGHRGFSLEIQATGASPAEKEVFSEAQTLAAVQGGHPNSSAQGRTDQFLLPTAVCVWALPVASPLCLSQAWLPLCLVFFGIQVWRVKCHPESAAGGRW